MRIVVVGAGYAGTFAANRLARKLPAAEVTVLNARPEFVERVRLHQRIVGSHEASTPLSAMLRDGITARVGVVDKLGAGAAHLADGASLEFDYAFLAVGSASRPMPGTVPVDSWEGAQRARAALAALGAGDTVTVVGGGSTGIETATEVAEARPDLRVRLVGAAIADYFAHSARDRVLAGLARLNVEVVADTVVDIAERGTGAGPTAGLLRLSSGARLSSELTLWAVVAEVPALAARSGLEVDASGRAVVDHYLRSVSDGRIFAIGDCAGVPGARFACQVALPQASHAVDTLARLVAGRVPRPYSWRYFGQGVSLGRKDAVNQFAYRDDTPRRAYFAGGAAALTKEAASRGIRAVTRAGIGI
ncbi:NADH dehydrogenase FAD-containing subunit [Tamaricihabitans halophyticus]|uniref:NADH dehydrogenase FAD-containing subunit n=1 Tax=Tamaricihabitans halophyticus TaxID=1262583 RepID=A0A4R2QNC2_9PSEU|nr:FAD-dependent oxidoreductase [Tamaricihabitans halophyticus]TCP48561.1 NADH dehydrogenase FAD-containing subunit [Tamaricihabitans halophyticus]